MPDRKQKQCGHSERHIPHVWTSEVQSVQPGAVRHLEKFWCPGREEPAHVHDWQSEPNLPDGPAHCACGKSVWVSKGKPVRKLKQVVRFPQADPMERILALRAKLSRNVDKWSPEDQAEIEAIGAALIETIKPLTEALVKVAEAVTAHLKAFFDALPPELIAQLAEAAKAMGEKPDAVETIDIYESGQIVDTVVVSHDPVSAFNAANQIQQQQNGVQIVPGDVFVKGQRWEVGS